MGYLLIVIIIACLLMLPLSSAHNDSQKFVDALFMATSGISTTGLGVVDTGSYYSTFGQIILMIDFQIGGIGYMSLYILMAYMLKKRISYKTKIVAKESLSGAEIGNSWSFFRMVILYTLFFEIIGGFLLSLFWLRQYPIVKALYLGLFHSISAFCTAGFCLFPDSLMSCKNSFLVNITVILVSLAGGFGFFVLHDICMTGRFQFTRKIRFRLSVHTRLALIVTFFLLLLGITNIMINEKWDDSVRFPQRFMDASFQTVSASTTDGYNTMDIGKMMPSSLVIIMLLMFVGASPGSTGGGIKTTTLGVIVLSIKSQFRGRIDTNCMERRVSQDVIRRSFSIFFLFLGVIFFDLLILCITERASFLALLFEIISALGNTGLSMGITSQLSELGKIILSATMFIGRVGPLTMGLAMLGCLNQSRYRYPEENIFVG
jgi:trk system potassium uptake protein TrkH